MMKKKVSEVINNNHNDITKTTSTITTSSTTATNQSNTNSNTNSSDASTIFSQSNNDDLFYDKHYNEETFMHFDDNEESGNNIPQTSPLLSTDKLASHHIKQAEDALSRLKSEVDQPGWKKILTHRHGAVVYGKYNDKLPIFMGEHIIKGFAPQSVFAVIGTRKLWDDWYEEGNLVENLNENTSLTYIVIQALAGSKARDMSLVEKIECTLEGKIYFASTSVNTPKIPHISNRIRAHIYLNGWILEPLSYNPPATKINYILQTDVKGWVPAVIVNKYLTRRPLIIDTIDTYLQKNGPPTMFLQAANTNTFNDHSTASLQHTKSILSTTKNNNNNNNNNNNDNNNNGESNQNGDRYNISSLSGLIHNNNDNDNDNDNDNININIDESDSNNKTTTSSTTNGPKFNSARRIKFSDQAKIHSKSFSTSSKRSPRIIPSIVADTNNNHSKLIKPSSSSPSLPITATPATIPFTPRISTATPIRNITSSKKKYAKIPEKNRTTHRHSETLRAAIDNFKSQAKSLDGWNFYSDDKGVKIYTKDVGGKSIPMIRGESRISGGFTVEDILSIINSVEMRKIWDERFEDSVVLEKLNHFDNLVKSVIKGSFPISGRDLSLASSTDYDFETGIVRYVSTSVIDPLIPETKKYVRAQLDFAGFEFVSKFDDDGFTKYVDIKYIADINVKIDTVPSLILRQVSMQTPIILNRIDELLQKSGFPPYVRESTSQTSMKSCVVNTKTFECDIEVVDVFGGAVTELKTSRKMYPNGYELTIQPENVKVELLPNKVEVVRIMFPTGNDYTNMLKIKIKRNTSKGINFIYNGGKSIPLASSSSSSSSSSSPSSLSPSSTSSSNKNTKKGSISKSSKLSSSSSIKTSTASINSPSLPIFKTSFITQSDFIRVPSISTSPPSIPLPPLPTSAIVSNSNSNNDDGGDETSTSALAGPLRTQSKNNNDNNQMFRHLTNVTTTTDEEGKSSQRISINNLNDHFASPIEPFGFNVKQAGLMFASMLLMYYAGRLGANI